MLPQTDAYYTTDNNRQHGIHCTLVLYNVSLDVLDRHTLQ